MKIGIYSEMFQGATLGGREFIVAVAGEALAQRQHSVEFLHHEPKLTEDEFAARFGIPRGCLQMRLIPNRPAATLRRFWQTRRERQAWVEGITIPYDCFIHVVHEIPLPCSAPHGVLMVLFPFYEPFKMWSGREIPEHGASRLWVLARHLSYRLAWKRRMESYQLKTSISRYVQTWARRRWKIDSTVLYPPSDGSFHPGVKSNMVLSVGRFSGAQHRMVNKRQVEMMEAFCSLSVPEASAWQYRSVGGLGASAHEQAYFDDVAGLARKAAGGRAEAVANAPRKLLSDLYGQARIFWHAAGLDNDEEETPELSEHFGIATVDAMSAGCVPVVIKKGAQGEIVEHGKNGFLWKTLDELKEFTTMLMRDPALLSKMSEDAQERARMFSREAFLAEFLKLFPDPIAQGAANT